MQLAPRWRQRDRRQRQAGGSCRWVCVTGAQAPGTSPCPGPACPRSAAAGEGVAGLRGGCSAGKQAIPLMPPGKRTRHRHTSSRRARTCDPMPGRCRQGPGTGTGGAGWSAWRAVGGGGGWGEPPGVGAAGPAAAGLLGRGGNGAAIDCGQLVRSRACLRGGARAGQRGTSNAEIWGRPPPPGRAIGHPGGTHSWVRRPRTARDRASGGLQLPRQREADAAAIPRVAWLPHVEGACTPGSLPGACHHVRAAGIARRAAFARPGMRAAPPAALSLPRPSRRRRRQRSCAISTLRSCCSAHHRCRAAVCANQPDGTLLCTWLTRRVCRAGYERSQLKGHA